MVMTDKSRRQQKIVNFVRSHELSTQAELVELLEKAGLEFTQSSVSRDIEELGIVKVRGVYRVPEGEAAAALPAGARELKRAGDNLIVVLCESGFASAISVAIEQAGLNDIVGTIAGDDTIFIAVDGAKAQSRLAAELGELLALDLEKNEFG